MLMTEMLEPLHHVARELAEYEHQKKTHLVEFYDDDVMAIVIVFNHILSNRKIHDQIQRKITAEKAVEEVKIYADSLRGIVAYMTGIDTKTYYNKDK